MRESPSDLTELRLIRIHLLNAQLLLGDRNYLDLGSQLHDAKAGLEMIIGRMERVVEVQQSRFNRRGNR